MGAPNPELTAADLPSAESLLGALKTINGSEKQKHVSVLDYWLSIRGDREFPPLHDLDPLEISDAGPSSLLLELIGGGEDAEIRHLGAGLKDFVEGDRIATAPRPSILASIAKKLSHVAISRNFLAFEDEFTLGAETTRCWVTLYPLSAAGAWVDYVYALVSLETKPAEEVAEVSEGSTDPEESELVQQEDFSVLPAVEVDEAPPVEAEVEVEVDEVPPVEAEVEVEAAEKAGSFEDSANEVESVAPANQQKNAPDAVVGTSKVGPGFTKLLESLAGLGGFYATHAAEAEVNFTSESVADEAHDSPGITPVDECESDEPVDQTVTDEVIEDSATVPKEPERQEPIAPAEGIAEITTPDDLDETVPAIHPEPVGATEQVTKSTVALEGSLQSKLADVRTKADEARLAKLRANAALYEGLSAAYDFALDAEEAPEEYLQIVQAQGLKIQLRSPMKPVVKLAFDGLCDESTIGQLEAVLAWAIKQELPRGTLAERLEEEGGIAQVLNGEAKAA